MKYPKTVYRGVYTVYSTSSSIVKIVSTILTIQYHWKCYPKVGMLTFFNVRKSKSAYFWAHSPIANPQILQECQPANCRSAIFMVNPPIANPQIFSVSIPLTANPQFLTFRNSEDETHLFKRLAPCRPFYGKKAKLWPETLLYE